ncbi:MAG: FtsQ-type POTRA domain-containing protein [Coriobacteriia bacterium]|nr:FtsQ-type POTRA domain-containing protein [Coriobacteriia bacterium]
MASNYSQRPGSPGSSRPSVAGSRASRSASGPRVPQNLPDPRRISVTAQQGGRSRGAYGQVSSTRIGDLPGMQGTLPSERRAAKQHKRSKAAIVVTVLVVLVLAVLVAAVVLRYSGAFPVNNLSIKGVEHLTDAEITELAAVPSDTTLLQVDTESIRSRLLQDTWIKDVRVNLVFPDTLEIAVTERTIAAVVEIAQKDSSVTKKWAIASDGVWLMPIPERDSTAGQATSEKIYEDADAVLHIEGVPYTTSPEMGKVCDDDNVNNALDIVDGMTTELANSVKTVVASDPDSTTLILDNGVEIAFGTAEDIRTKERVCLQLLEEYADQVAYINVRTVDRPTWRSV